MTDPKPPAELTCACGHLLAQHDSPGGNPVPWGRCHAIGTGPDGNPQRCQCREAWPIEEGE